MLFELRQLLLQVGVEAMLFVLLKGCELLLVLALFYAEASALLVLVGQESLPVSVPPIRFHVLGQLGSVLGMWR